MAKKADKDDIKTKLRQQFPRAPVDDEGFVQGFEVEDVHGYMEFLRIYGFCVVKVLDDELCDRAVRELFEFVNSAPNANRKAAVNRDDPSTWDDVNWPGSGKYLFDDPGFTQSSFDIRTHKNIYILFKNIFGGNPKLYTSIDAWGLMRGTRDLQIGGELVERPSWRWDLDPHWDVDPWNHIEDLKQNLAPQLYQGMVALDNCPEEVGGFCCVPACTPNMNEWVTDHIPPKGWSRKVPLKQFHPTASEPILSRMQRLPLRKGHILVWNSLQLHLQFSKPVPKYAYCTIPSNVFGDTTSSRQRRKVGTKGL